MDSGVGDRIKKIKEHFCGGHGTHAQFSEMLGENPTTVSNWIRDKNRVLGVDKIIKILVTFPVDANWLLRGNGKMLLNEQSSSDHISYSGKFRDVQTATGTGQINTKENNSDLKLQKENTTLKERITSLKKENEYLNTIVVEKERLITILINKK